MVGSTHEHECFTRKLTCQWEFNTLDGSGCQRELHFCSVEVTSLDIDPYDIFMTDDLDSIDASREVLVSVRRCCVRPSASDRLGDIEEIGSG
jgi:hypothetical protein